MKLEQQICNPELATELYELGVPQKSVWGYFQGLTGFKVLTSESTLNGQSPKMSAFTVAELGEMLPDWIKSKKNSSGGEKWFGNVIEQHVMLPKRMQEEKIWIGMDCYADTEADVRAKLLIKLLELVNAGTIEWKI